jgi:hypothetical protein
MGRVAAALSRTWRWPRACSSQVVMSRQMIGAGLVIAVVGAAGSARANQCVLANPPMAGPALPAPDCALVVYEYGDLAGNLGPLEDLRLVYEDADGPVTGEGEEIEFTAEARVEFVTVRGGRM